MLFCVGCLFCCFFFFFFFNDTATTEIYTGWYTLSLHDALPIRERERRLVECGQRLERLFVRPPRVAPFLEWCATRALPSGVLSEQVHPYTGEPLSVSPLTWSHAAFVSAVQRYARRSSAIKDRVRAQVRRAG